MIKSFPNVKMVLSVMNVQRRAFLVHVQGNFLEFRFVPLDSDNFTARDPWTWRWREETKVISYASESELLAGPMCWPVWS